MSVVPTKNVLSAYLPKIIEIARVTGEAIMEIYQKTDFKVSEKGDKTPVTDADYRAHNVIKTRLGQLEPGYPLLSEESTAITFSERRMWSTYWLVDPLDGTREFIKKNGEFSVNIALVHQHEAILGVVYAPVKQVAYAAGRGLGCWCYTKNQPPKAMCVRAVSQPPVIAVSRSHCNPKLRALLGRVGAHETMQMGSALKFCLLAEAKADCYPRLSPSSEWDTAAGQCVLEEAGGCLLDGQGSRVRYNTKESLLNPHFFAFGGAKQDWIQLFLERNL